MSEKADLRDRMMRLRATLPAPDIQNLTALFEGGFAPFAGRVVAGYAAMRGELDPAALLKAAHDGGAQTCLPCIDQPAAPLIFRAYVPGEALIAGRHRTREPAPERPLCAPDLVLVPLLAADLAGHRLGYGGGYYDRTLAGLDAVAVGLCFEGQVLDRVPREAHDRRLDFVLTPGRLIDCKT
mgnify:CR=1 FL=1